MSWFVPVPVLEKYRYVTPWIFRSEGPNSPPEKLGPVPSETQPRCRGVVHVPPRRCRVMYMSPTGGVIPGVAPQAARSETNSSLPPPSGVGQNSWSPVLIAEPRFVIGPHVDRLFGRSATQMSFFPNPPARVEATYSFRPSGDLIGQPSWAAVFTSVTAVGAPHPVYSVGP